MVSSCADKLYRVKYRRESTESVSKCLGFYTQAASTVNQADESLDFTRMDKLFIHNILCRTCHSGVRKGALQNDYLSSIVQWVDIGWWPECFVVSGIASALCVRVCVRACVRACVRVLPKQST